MTLEGKVHVKVAWDGRCITGCEVASRRPVEACRTFVGRRPGEALALVPRLYTLCGQAQLAAARHALEAAGGQEPGEEALLRRRLGVIGEIAAEYLWRFLIDLPQALGEPPLVAPVANVRSHLAAAGAPAPEAELPGGLDLTRWRAPALLLKRVLEEQLLGVAPEQLVALDAEGFRGWRAQAPGLAARLLRRVQEEGFAEWGRSATPLMPAPGAGLLVGLAAGAAQPRFAERPALAGVVYETGALARCARRLPLAGDGEAGHGVLARLAARLLELCEVALELERLAEGGEGAARMGGLPLAESCGAGWVETARGLLLHRVALEAGRVAQWAILAPTEWNFHPAGPLAAGLIGSEAADQARLVRGVRLCVLALDPCVAYDLEVVRA